MGSDHPIPQLDHLDTLWFQVAETLCNLRCNHCFISCSPENHTLNLMSFKQVLPYLQEAVHLGVKEFYFTGGEPFVNPHLPKILEATLRIGPATVLTNATLFGTGLLQELAAMRDASKYSLELRVSLALTNAAVGYSPLTLRKF
jgi:AdoMet-dependent heme synthase